ncbi:hypothetical protein ACFQ44_10765 [Levilactobacillus lanxiensis]|uniref:Uncharacterized protein n=1 Tax=Levilactobacillus lanxiensis TaxID=2799568 RepID=A0ABW4D8G6_9LACO|nr:hypothetical protein [Levilactobacillus lanxiensis]
MKLMKIVSVVMVATTMGTAVVVATPGVTADAKAKKSLKTFPKSLRRTWYHYEKNDNGKFTYSKLTFTAKSLTMKWAGWGTTKVNKADKYVLHQYNPAKKLQKGKDSWIFAYKAGKSTKMGGWNTTKSAMTAKDALSSYKVVTAKVNGRKVKVLHDKHLTSLPVDIPYYYTSKQLAKQTNPKGYNYTNAYGAKK